MRAPSFAAATVYISAWLSRECDAHRLSENRLQHIRRDAFRGLSELQVLQLDRFARRFIKRCNPQLTYQLIDWWPLPRSNHIETLEADSFADLPNLHMVALQRNRLRRIPGTLFLHTSRMSRLYVDACFGHALVLSHERLCRDLSYNQLDSHAFAATRAVPRLEVLDVSHNRISAVGSAFKFLHHLQVLYVAPDPPCHYVSSFIVGGNRRTCVGPAA